ncbi:hypothetical protein PIB30_040491 [Stylosanthes scabra]|uniref:Uncharacterized protein n=1 Tax=Stylosanthes scabra TaxID=79078 RepID=A0ABU6ZDA6_9FABA|nr:hypothetical protein [Stylosanthes scabra]
MIRGGKTGSPPRQSSPKSGAMRGGNVSRVQNPSPPRPMAGCGPPAGYCSREGVKFTSKNPTNVFITPRTRLSDFQRNIQRKICSTGRKRIGMIYYRILISVAAQGVMYGSFAIQADEDLQVLFHCRSQFPEVRTIELFVEMLALLASSGGSTLGQYFANVAEPSRRAIQAEPEAKLVASPTFGIYNEAEAGDLGADLGDTDIGAPQALCAPPVQRVPDPGVEEALGPMTLMMNHHS